MSKLVVNKYNRVVTSGSYTCTLKREQSVLSGDIRLSAMNTIDRTYEKITEHKSYDVPQINKINQGDAISIDYMGKIEPLSLIADNTNRFAGFAIDLPADYKDGQMRLATKGIILIDIDKADAMTPERFNPKGKEVYAIGSNRFTFDKTSMIKDKHSASKEEVNNLYIGNVLELVEVKNESNFAPINDTKYMYSVVFQASKQYEYVPDDKDVINAQKIQGNSRTILKRDIKANAPKVNPAIAKRQHELNQETLADKKALHDKIMANRVKVKETIKAAKVKADNNIQSFSKFLDKRNGK